MFHHIKWSFVNSAAQALGQFIQMLIAAWYLSPEIIGTWASFMLLYRLLTPFVEGGWSRLIIQEKNTDNTQLNTLFTYNVILGVFIAVVIAVCAPLLNDYFQIKNNTWYLLVFCGSFIFIGLGVQSNVLLQKELQFAKLAKVQITGILLELLVFYILLKNNSHIWSFIIAFLVKVAVQNILYFVIEPTQKKIENNYESVKQIVHWSKFDLGAQMLNYLYTNLDNLFIIHFLGKEALGFYTLAWDTAVKSASFFSPIITRVYYPLMSKAKAISALYTKGLSILMVFQIPFYCFLIFYTEEIVFYFYGSKWEKIIEPIKWLSLVAILRASGALGSSVFLINKKFKTEFYFQIFNTILVFIILLLCTSCISLSNIAKAMFLCHLIIMCIWHYYTWKIGKIEYLQVLFRIIVITAISLIITYIIKVLKT